jgi:hypothetical protein
MRLLPVFLLAACVQEKIGPELVEGTGWRQEVSDDCILEYDQTWGASEAICDDCEFVAEVTWILDPVSTTDGCGEFYAEKHETVGYRFDSRATFTDTYWVTDAGVASWEDGEWLFGNTSYDWTTDSITVASTIYETAIFYGE